MTKWHTHVVHMAKQMNTVEGPFMMGVVSPQTRCWVQGRKPRLELRGKQNYSVLRIDGEFPVLEDWNFEIEKSPLLKKTVVIYPPRMQGWTKRERQSLQSPVEGWLRDGPFPEQTPSFRERAHKNSCENAIVSLGIHIQYPQTQYDSYQNRPTPPKSPVIFLEPKEKTE